MALVNIEIGDEVLTLTRREAKGDVLAAETIYLRAVSMASV
jgi:hypothetical protein